jgi:serine/threonine protein phosphatase PrpC
MKKSAADQEEIDIEIEILPDVQPETLTDGPDSEQSGRLLLDGALRSDVGVVRHRNEDSCLLYHFESGGHALLPPFGLYIVADGMGGHDGGDRASKVASHTAAHELLQRLYLPLVSDHAYPDPPHIEQVMRSSVLSAHEAVRTPGNSGSGGTTLTIALVLDRQLYVAHVGDSRAYWLVDGNLRALTRDHSLVQRLQDEGKLTVEEAENFQYRNILLRALGQEEDLEVDVYIYELPAQGKLLLCSDGLSGQISDVEIRRIMDSEEAPGQIADRLITSALDAGGVDNISAIVVEFESQEAGSSR